MEVTGTIRAVLEPSPAPSLSLGDRHIVTLQLGGGGASAGHSSKAH